MLPICLPAVEGLPSPLLNFLWGRVSGAPAAGRLGADCGDGVEPARRKKFIAKYRRMAGDNDA